MLNVMTRWRRTYLIEKCSPPLPDAYRAIEPYSDSDCDLQLPHPERAYKIISSRIRVQGQNNCGSYYGRRAVYYILSHPAIRHVALALGSVCAQTKTFIITNSEPLFTESGIETGSNHIWQVQDNVFCLNILVVDSEQHFGWSPANAILWEMILASLIYLTGSADPAHLATQGHILYLSSLAEREQFDLDCRKGSYAHSEGVGVFSTEPADNLSSTPLHLMRVLRTLLLYGTVEEAWQVLEREEPGFKKAYNQALEQRERELDARITDDLKGLVATANVSNTAEMFLKRIQHLIPPAYAESGYNANDPAARSIVRSQTIAIFVVSHVDMEPDELARLLPRVNRWYNDNIRPFLESFSARTGIADIEEESPAHLLAMPGATIQPQHDPDVEQLLFAKDSLKLAQDPFALLYYGAYSGKLALVKRYRSLTWGKPSWNKSLAPILAAIEGENFSVIDWFLVSDPRYQEYKDVVLAAARAGGEVLNRVMDHMHLNALNGAFYKVGPLGDEQEDEQGYEQEAVTEALIEWLKKNENKDTSVYISAMGAAAAHDRWEDVMIFLRSDAVVHATFDDLCKGDNALDEEDDDILKSVIERAALVNDKFEIMEDLESFAKKVEIALNAAD